MGMQSENRGPDDGHVYVTDIHSQILGTYPASFSSCFGIVSRGASATGVAYIRLFCRVSTHRACTYISPFLCLTNKAFRKKHRKRGMPVWRRQAIFFSFLFWKENHNSGRRWWDVICCGLRTSPRHRPLCLAAAASMTKCISTAQKTDK